MELCGCPGVSKLHGRPRRAGLDQVWAGRETHWGCVPTGVSSIGPGAYGPAASYRVFSLRWAQPSRTTVT